MSSSRLFLLQGLMLACIAALYLAGIEFFLFWRLSWFDMLLHVLGGTWAALASAWALLYTGRTPSLPAVLLGVLAVSVGWEVFEYAFDLWQEADYLFDLATDLAMDASGGVLGALLVRFARP